MSPDLLFAVFLAGFAYVIMPGPAFLALLGLAASEGRRPAAWFVTGHLVGDVVWGTLALAALIGVSQLGPDLFDILGLACGVYLAWLGFRALLTKSTSGPAVIGKERPLLTGVLFGLTNPKAYPVSLAMFGALTASHAGDLAWADAPFLMAAAFVGFVAADMLLVFWSGLPVMRRFFARHGLIVTRLVGLTFVLFGAKSLADAGRSLASRHG